jgi:hypothetical protein
LSRCGETTKDAGVDLEDLDRELGLVLPALAGDWFARYDAGYDVSRWYTAARNQPS